MDHFPSTLRAAQAGEDWAVGVLWRALNPRLVRFLAARAGDAAEDIASETWLAAARNLTTFSGGDIEFRAWMFTIARRRLADWQRRESRQPRTASDDAAMGSAVADDDPGAEALAALGTEGALALVNRLPADQAEVVLLRVLGDFDAAQVARIMGKRPGTVRMLQHRGLRRLAELVGPPDRQHLDRDVTR